MNLAEWEDIMANQKLQALDNLYLNAVEDEIYIRIYPDGTSDLCFYLGDDDEICLDSINIIKKEK